MEWTWGHGWVGLEGYEHIDPHTVRVHGLLQRPKSHRTADATPGHRHAYGPWSVCGECMASGPSMDHSAGTRDLKCRPRIPSCTRERLRSEMDSAPSE